MKLTAQHRRWVYLVAMAVLPLLIAYGVLGDRDAALWAALIGAVLVPDLARRNINPED